MSVKTILQTLTYQLTKLTNPKNCQKELFEIEKLNAQGLKKLLYDKIIEFNSLFISKKLFVFIDSIDELYDEDSEYKWIIHDLPKHVKFVYSTSIVQNNSASLLAEEAFKLDVYGFHSLNIRDFEFTEAIDILNEWLLKNDRQLTELQQIELRNLLMEKSKLTPLYLKLIFNIVNKWPSNFRPDIEFRFCATIKDALKYYFDKLEKIYGRLFLSKCLFLICLFNNGINEAQLIDILSLDNEILTNIMNIPKNIQMQRFPAIFWLRLKHDLSDFLVEKEFNGFTVLSW